MDSNSSQYFDIAIIGNGIIGSLAAVEVSKHFPDKKICLIAQNNRNQSASLAAGAMHAVFGEVVRGMDVFNAIATSPTGSGGPFVKDVPTQTIIIQSINVIGN